MPRVADTAKEIEKLVMGELEQPAESKPRRPQPSPSPPPPPAIEVVVVVAPPLPLPAVDMEVEQPEEQQQQPGATGVEDTAAAADATAADALDVSGECWPPRLLSLVVAVGGNLPGGIAAGGSFGSLGLDDDRMLGISTVHGQPGFVDFWINTWPV